MQIGAKKIEPVHLIRSELIEMDKETKKGQECSGLSELGHKAGWQFLMVPKPLCWVCKHGAQSPGKNVTGRHWSDTVLNTQRGHDDGGGEGENDQGPI